MTPAEVFVTLWAAGIVCAGGALVLVAWVLAMWRRVRQVKGMHKARGADDAA